MRIAKFPTLTAIVLILGIPSAAASSEPLRLVLALDSETYQVGQPIVYVVTLENTSEAAIDGVHEIDTSANGFGLSVEKDGKPLRRVGLFKNVIYFGPGRSIEPGGCLVAVDNVLSQYGERRNGKIDPRRAEGFILQPGRYCIRAYFQPYTEGVPSERRRGVRSEETCITIGENGPPEHSAEFADSVLATIQREGAGSATKWGPICASALRKYANTSAYWFLLECAHGALDVPELIKVLGDVVEGRGSQVRRAAILDRAIRGGAASDSAEVATIASTLLGPTRELERRVAGSWVTRYSQGWISPARRVRP